MKNLIKQLTLKQFMLELLPSFSISLFIAEFYYKMGSFTLECISFLITWFTVDTILSKILSNIKMNKK